MKEIKKKNAYSSASEDKQEQEQDITVVTRQKGVTLIEILIYMAIALIFIALAGGRISDAFSSLGAQTETDNIISLISATKETRGRAGYGSSVASLVPTLDSLNRIPNALSVTGSGTSTRIVNSWDGDVTVESAGGSTLNSFVVSTDKVPKAACIKIVQRISETGLVLDTESTTGGKNSTIPLTAIEAAGMCTADSNKIEWTVKG